MIVSTQSSLPIILGPLPCLALRFNRSDEHARLSQTALRVIDPGARPIELEANTVAIGRWGKSLRSLCIALLLAKALHSDKRNKKSDELTIEETNEPQSWILTLADALQKSGRWSRSIFTGSDTAKTVVFVRGGRTSKGRKLKGTFAKQLVESATAYYQSNTILVSNLRVFVGASSDLRLCEELRKPEDLWTLAKGIKDQIRAWKHLSLPALPARTGPIAEIAYDKATETEAPGEMMLRESPPALLPAPGHPGRMDAAQRRAMFSRVVAGGGCLKTLRMIYPQYPPLELLGKPSPVTILDQPRDPEGVDMETILGKPDLSKGIPGPREYDRTFDERGLDSFNALLAKEARNPDECWNGLTYDLGRLEKTSQGFKLHTRMGRHFAAVATCDALEDEMLRVLSANPNSALQLADLPRREWLHSHVKDPVKEGLHRSPAIAISTLTLFFCPDVNRYCFFVNPRSASVGMHAYLYHVAPAGMFQPIFHPDKPDLEHSVKFNILREFYEELYDAPEVRQGSGYVSHRSVYRKPPIKRLLKMFGTRSRAKRADLYYTGLVVNLLNLRLEICALLVIRDREWFDGTVCLNPEFLSGPEIRLVPPQANFAPEKLLSYMELGDGLQPTKPELLSAEHVTPPGAAAIEIGLQAARRLL